MKKEISIPKQTRSMDKKNRIVEAGYVLFADNGYYNVSTTEIAQAAGVSTGSVYRYFQDKKDILKEVLNEYFDRTYGVVFTMIEEIKSPVDFISLLDRMIDAVIKVHQDNKAIHSALHGMAHTDEGIENSFKRMENETTKRIAARLTAEGYPSDRINEKAHLALRCVEDFAHEYVYDAHDYIEYDAMKKLTIEMLNNLFETE